MRGRARARSSPGPAGGTAARYWSSAGQGRALLRTRRSRHGEPKVACEHPVSPPLFPQTSPSPLPLHNRELPGELEEIRIFFRDSKVPDGKPPNTFGFDDQPINREQTLAVIEQTHGFWQALVSGERENTEDKSLF